MFERFDVAARRVVVLANAEAFTLDHNFIGTEHLLLGLLAEGEGVAARVLTELGIGHDAVLAQVEQTLGRGTGRVGGHVPFTESAKQAMESSFRESLGLGHNHIGTEHILLALVGHENDAAQMLAHLGADAALVRERVLAALG